MARASHGGSAGQPSVLILGEGAGAKRLKATLSDGGHDVVGVASTKASAEKLFKSKLPRVIVMSLSEGGSEAALCAPSLLATRRCPLIAVAESAAEELVKTACDCGACGFLVEPITAEALAAQIRVSTSRFDDLERLIAEKEQIAQNLETRKLVERAKAVLIKRAGLSEPDAHRRLQQESQKRRMSIGEVAKRIVESDEILGD